MTNVPDRELDELVQVALNDAGAALYQLHGRGPILPHYRLLGPRRELAPSWDVSGFGGIVRPRPAPAGVWRWLSGVD